MTLKFLPAFIWLIIITMLSTKGGVSMPKFNLIQMDKLAHASAYALLVWLILLGWRRMRPQEQVGLGLGLAVFLFATGYGAFMEWVQYAYFPDRFFETDDMLANAVGAAVAGLSFNRIALALAKFSWTGFT